MLLKYLWDNPTRKGFVLVKVSFKKLVLATVITLFASLTLMPAMAQAANYEEVALLKLINNYRASKGLGKLVLSEKLTKAASRHSYDMATKDYFSHTSRDGAQFSNRIKAAGYTYNTNLGENLAAGFWKAADVFNGWKKSPGHNKIMLGKTYKAVGISRAYSPDSSYRWYWTADFGGQVDSSKVARASEADNWAYDYVQKLKNQKILSGYPDGTYRPENPVTRAEFAVMIGKLLGVGPKNSYAFKDTGRHWANGYIAALAGLNYINGYNDGTFRPNSLISRAEMVKIITRSCNLKLSSNATSFPDTADHWAENYISIVSSNGIINGYVNGMFRPDAICLRSDAAASVYRLVQ